MKKILLTSLVASALATAAFAAPDVSGYYGNTVVFHAKDGSVAARMYFNADGTYNEFRGGKTMVGKYTFDDKNQMCLTRTDMDNPKTFCHPFDSHKVGDKWDEGQGDRMTNNTLESGHI